MRRPAANCRPPLHLESRLNSSRFPRARICASRLAYLTGGPVKFRKAGRIAFGGCAWLMLALLWCAPAIFAQGAAPETAPSLFPGGGLLSYSSSFETRRPMQGLADEIPATARPTLSHAGELNFTWGFHRNMDVTALVPIVTNHFRMSGGPSAPSVGGTGLGDAMVLVKY